MPPLANINVNIIATKTIIVILTTIEIKTKIINFDRGHTRGVIQKFFCKISFLGLSKVFYCIYCAFDS